MERLIPGAIVALFVIFLLWQMWRAWRTRTRRGARIELPQATVSGPPIAVFERVFFVATTVSGMPLERVAIPGLTYRGYSTIDVYADGLTVQVEGEHPVTIPAHSLVGADTAQMRIDKVVEQDGLATLAWHTGEHALESSFRFAHSEQQLAFMRAIHTIVPAGQGVPEHQQPAITEQSGPEA